VTVFGEVTGRIINSSFFASHLALGLSEMIFGHHFGYGVFRAAFCWLRRFDWEPPILIDLPNCAAVDTELQVRDALIEVWLDGWPKVDG